MPERNPPSLQFNEVQAQIAAVASISPIGVSLRPGVSRYTIFSCIRKGVGLGLGFLISVSTCVQIPQQGTILQE